MPANGPSAASGNFRMAERSVTDLLRHNKSGTVGPDLYKRMPIDILLGHVTRNEFRKYLRRALRSVFEHPITCKVRGRQAPRPCRRHEGMTLIGPSDRPMAYSTGAIELDLTRSVPRLQSWFSSDPISFLWRISCRVAVTKSVSLSNSAGFASRPGTALGSSGGGGMPSRECLRPAAARCAICLPRRSRSHMPL